MSQRELSNAKIIFGGILESRPSRTYSRKGKNREVGTVLPALKPTLQKPKGKTSSDPIELRVTKKILRDVSTQPHSWTAASPDPVQVGEVKQATQVGKRAEASQVYGEDYVDVNQDGSNRFSAEYSDPEEESSGEKDEMIRLRHSKHSFWK